MIADQLSATAKPLLDSAWTILDAANDLRDAATVEACRRVIDATFRGGAPAQSDINIVLDFFN
ncbi:MAG: hypothetical protein ACJ8EE_10445 [Bradyrhizobium sp.]